MISYWNGGNKEPGNIREHALVGQNIANHTNLTTMGKIGKSVGSRETREAIQDQ
jgi:hypothetical protein